MKIENLDLHGLNLQEAVDKVENNLKWCIKNNVDVIVINHGRGLHSQRNFSVIKKEIRKMLKTHPLIQESPYRIIYGESDFPIALTYNEGNTLLVTRGLENELLGGRVQQEKNMRIFSAEGKQQRKISKKMNAEKRRRFRY